MSAKALDPTEVSGPATEQGRPGVTRPGRPECTGLHPEDDEAPTPVAADSVRQAEIARLIAVGVHPDVARGLRSCEESNPPVDRPEQDLVERLESLGRVARRGCGRVPVRPTSEGADFVRYSSEAAPATPHRQRQEAANVVLAPELQGVASRDAPTVLIARRSGGVPRAAWAGGVGVLAAIALVVAGRSWMERPSANHGIAREESVAPPPSRAEPERLVTAEPAPAAEDGAPPAMSAIVAAPSAVAAAHRAGSARAIAPATTPSGAASRAPELDARRRPAATEVMPGRSSEARQHYLLDLP